MMRFRTFAVRVAEAQHHAHAVTQVYGRLPWCAPAFAKPVRLRGLLLLPVLIEVMLQVLRYIFRSAALSRC